MRDWWSFKFSDRPGADDLGGCFWLALLLLAAGIAAGAYLWSA